MRTLDTLLALFHLQYDGSADEYSVCVCVCVCERTHTGLLQISVLHDLWSISVSLSISPSLSVTLSISLSPSPSLSVTYSTISCVSSGHIGCFDLAHHPTLSCHAQRMLYPHKYIMSISIELVGLMKYIAEPVGEYIVRIYYCFLMHQSLCMYECVCV